MISLLLDYALKFLKTGHEKNVNFFAAFVESSVTRYSQKYYKDFDETYFKFLKDLNSSGILDKNILFFMSAEGLR